MRKTIHAALAIAAVGAASLVLAGCPMQPSYDSTITPIYAATTSGLSVYNGTNWTNYTAPGSSKAVVVFGSGSGATVLVGGNGVFEFDGTTWTPRNTGLGSPTVNSLTIGTAVYASTSGGLSVLNSDGTWANSASVTPVNDAFVVGAQTLVAGGTAGAAGLYIYNGTSLVGGAAIPPTAIASSSTKVTSVFVDAFGDVVAGTDTGFGIRSGTSWLQTASASVNRVYADLFGNIYAATTTGLYIVNTSATLTLSGKSVNSVCVDGAGTIYAGTSTGLMISKDGGLSWTTQLASQNITAVTTTAPLYSF